MALLITSIALVPTIGFFLLLNALRNAPEGYQDETGFHLTDPVEDESPKPCLVPVRVR